VAGPSAVATPRPNVVGPDWRPPAPEPYSYLLGLYLGDGHIVLHRGSAFIRLSLDERYERIIAEADAALRRVLPIASVKQYRFGKARRVILQLSHPDLPYVFPQHGRGRKHARRIVLVPWQATITRRHPHALIRGLIHSDGCRCANRFSVRLPSGRVGHYEYARYFFSNLSKDIRDIFCSHCELLGIRWTRSNPRNISISDRASVALLDSFVGPKT
jgi:hypothetical protein